MEKMIKKVVACHLMHSPYLKDKIKNLEIKPVLHSFDNRGCPISSSIVSDYKFVIWSHLAALLAPMIKPLFIFSTSIPTFFDLSWDDRLLCLKLRFFEIWIIHASSLVNCDYGTMTFSNGCYISRHQLEIIYDEKFVCQLFNFAGCLKDLQLSDSALALYSAVVLYSADESKTKKPLLLQKIQEKYKIYLSYQLHVLDQQPEAFDILSAMLPELQDIGKKHLYYAKRISLDILPYAEEPVLLADVFNLTKEEDITKFMKGVCEENMEQEES